MSLEGRIENGCVVFDEPVPLAEGTAVRVEPLSTAAPPTGDARPLAERLKGFLACPVDLPADAATQHDHYLYGVPKK